jgi:LAO/AO transport system kinase
MDLINKMLSGDEFALSQLITKLENDLIDTALVTQKIHGRLDRSYCVGVTGPPGVGKSTLIDKLAVVIKKKGLSLGIIVVDPSSSVSGGALLGDRIRLQSHNLDDDIFIRSMSTRGHSGGLSKKVSTIVKVLQSFGKDLVLLETVGTGQVEIDVVNIANTNILVLAPNAGDIIQAMKAGIMELADIFVVNKADLGKADHMLLDIETIITQRKGSDNWMPPVLEAEARNSKGIDIIYENIELHREFLQKEGLLFTHFRKREAVEFINLAKEEMLNRVMKYLYKNHEFRTLLEKVEAGELDAYSAFKEMSSICEIFEKR